MTAIGKGMIGMEKRNELDDGDWRIGLLTGQSLIQFIPKGIKEIKIKERTSH